jgi:hypothetical protein
MDIVEILVLTLSIPVMCLVLLILTCVEGWLGEATEDGWAFRPADARRPLLMPVRTTTSLIRDICHDRKLLAKLSVVPTNRPNTGLTEIAGRKPRPEASGQG